MAKILIDSNQLRTDDLRTFLSESPKNLAVLADVVAMEAYKHQAIKTMAESMSVLKDFPRQVLVLKGGGKLKFMHGKLAGLQRRLIDDTQSEEFPKFLDALEKAVNGDPAYVSAVERHAKFAREHFSKLQFGAEEMRQALTTFSEIFSPQERAAFRNESGYSDEMRDKIGNSILELTAFMIGAAGMGKRLASLKEAANMPIFRVATAVYLHGVRLYALGSLANRSAANLRNDFVDMTLVGYATYFDGILSGDRNVRKMYEHTCFCLHGMFGAHVPAVDRLSAGQ
ncbi:hypothetical protein [Pandoraea sputorum]|nr:hypothetical protein [Pandoraea sputorum]